MKPSISFWQMAGFIVAAVLGTLLHFLFDWTGGSVFAALFSAVNESIWEHMKLLYYPMLLFALIEYRAWGKKMSSFWRVKLVGMLAGLTLIPGALGVEADWFNIAIFFLTAGYVYWLESRLFRREKAVVLPNTAALGLLALIGLLFVVFTFLPPELPLFQDPVTGSYGFQLG